MSQALERVIDALTDHGRSVSDAVRSLFVVARRLGSDSLSEWLDHELTGYPPDAEVPTYRELGDLPVSVRFAGPGGSSYSQYLDQMDLPEGLRPGIHDLRQSVAELGHLVADTVPAAGSKDGHLGVPLPLAWITLLREYGARGQAPRVDMMVAESASLVVPRSALVGALDAVRTAALRLALDLEETDPRAGEPGHSSAPAQEVGDTFITNVYGDAQAVTQGPGATTLLLQPGDITGLMAKVSDILDLDGVEALRVSLEEDGGQPGAKTRALLERVKSGGVHLGGGIAGNAAYGLIVGLINMVFPGALPF